MNTPVSLELGKLLKEKGYPFEFITVGEIKEVPLNIPTVAEVIMWLYEKHKIWMWVEKGVNPDNFYPVIQNHVNFKYSTFKYSTEYWRDSISEAYEAGIEYVLKKLELIEQLYEIKETKSGNLIESNLLHYEAVEHVREFEEVDKHQGIYIDNFYEIVLMNHKS